MKAEKQSDALKQMKLNLNTILQLVFALLAGVFCCAWISCPSYGGEFAIYHGPFEFRNLGDAIAYGYPATYQWLQLICALLFIACVVCFFVFGARSEKSKKAAYQYFLEHREEFENQAYLSENGKYYRAMVKDYLKVNSCFGEKKGKVFFLYKKLTGYLRYPMIVSAVLIPGCVLAYTAMSAHSEVSAAIAILIAIASMLCWFVFAFYFILVKHRSRSFKNYAIELSAEQIETGDYSFDQPFMEYIAADEKLSARAEKMQAAGQKGVIPYIFSDPVTAVLLGGMAIYLIVIVFIAALVISIVSPNAGKTATPASANAAKQTCIVIYGPAYGDKYQASVSGGGIRRNGTRTGFALKQGVGGSMEIVRRNGDRTEVIGWLRDGGSRTVDYANDYDGEKPFLRWDIE